MAKRDSNGSISPESRAISENRFPSGARLPSPGRGQGADGRSGAAGALLDGFCPGLGQARRVALGGLELARGVNFPGGFEGKGDLKPSGGADYEAARDLLEPRDRLGDPPLSGVGDLQLEETLALMAWGRSKGASDLVFTSEDSPWLRLEGQWRKATPRRFRLTDLASLLNRLTRNEAAAAMVLSGVEMDFSCEVPLGRRESARFRGNASAVANSWSTGLSLTLRALPDQPPELESLHL